MRSLLSRGWNALQLGGDQRSALPTYDAVPGEGNSDEKLLSAYSSPWASLRPSTSTRSSSRSPSPDVDAASGNRAGSGTGWKRAGVAALGGLIVGVVLARSAHDPVFYDGPTRTDVWKQYEIKEKSIVGTKSVKKLPRCERTVVLEWESWQYGFGSTTISTLQAMVFAKQHNYEVAFSRGANPYGSYLDYFEPHRPIHCDITEDVYREEGAIELQEVTDETRLASADAPDPDQTPRLKASAKDTHPLNRFIRDTTFTSEDLYTLPALDSSRPVFARDTVPDLYTQRFLQYSAVTATHFQLNARVKAWRDSLRLDMGLLVRQERPTIGMHFRGGDKLKHECKPSAQMSCGNLTLHCETALEALRTVAPEYRDFRLDLAKARLLLMTAEPDALERLAADPICQRHFVLVPFPRGGTDKSYKQADFYELSEDTRREDTQRFLAEADILANYVDAAVVSANSNTGRLILTRGGPTRVVDEHRIRSVDIPWHPMQFSPFAGLCDGTTGHCFPE
ncbi:hypothetical protein JCM10908_004729 [Rhodotorula pacifica]|uniref:uncharacterized protein n=1 Tax=Rhodotorula pacifica TaxID=1495444 RepID=UPI00317E9E92